MKTKLSLKRFEDLYDTFDGGHDRMHLEEVRDFAVKLAKKYCPNKAEIVYVAATLHDIGLSVSRDDHEQHGYEIIKNDEEIKNYYSKEDYKEILHAVKEHRATTGNPKTVIAKIVSDADKVGHGTVRAMQRAYEWGLVRLPFLNHEGQLIRAAYHLHEKFGTNGIGTRLYFKESEEKLQVTYGPIFEALEHYDVEKLGEMLK